MNEKLQDVYASVLTEEHQLKDNKFLSDTTREMTASLKSRGATFVGMDFNYIAGRNEWMLNIYGTADA